MFHVTLTKKPLIYIFTCIRHTHTFNGPFPGLPRWAGTRKVKPIWILLKQESEWRWYQLGHMQVCTLLQTDNHASTPPLRVFLQAGCPSCRPTNSVKALKAYLYMTHDYNIFLGDFSKLLSAVAYHVTIPLAKSTRLFTHSQFPSTSIWQHIFPIPPIGGANVRGEPSASRKEV